MASLIHVNSRNNHRHGNQIDKAARTQPPDYDRAESGAGHRVGRGPRHRGHPNCAYVERGWLRCGPVHPAKGCRHDAAETNGPSHLLPLQGRLRLLQHSSRRRPICECGVDLRGTVCSRRRDQGSRRFLSRSCRRDRGAEGKQESVADMTDLLSSVITAHGGLDRWRTVRAIDVTFNFSGGLLDIKGFPGHHRPSASVDAATPRTVFQRLGDESDERWIFTPNRVWIERRDGTVVEERFEPRAAFAGHVRETPWDRLHLTYFLGYAVWNYLTTPFLFARAGFVARELEPHVECRETWRVLEVTYPDDVPAHTKVQQLYFGDDFMLRRLDYVTE